MCAPINLTISLPLNKRLAEELNTELKDTLMPVTVFVGLETVFGFLGNLLILYVFLFHYHKCNFKYFVLCLAFVDITSTLTTMPGEIVTQTFWYVYPVPIVCKIKSFFNVFTVCGSAFCLLIISVDRFLKICRPLKWQIKPKVALILIFVQLTIAFVIALPVAFLWGTHSHQEQYKGYNITVHICEKDEKFECTKSPLIYAIFAESIVTIVMFAMFVLYIFVCRKLLKTKETAAGTSHPASDGHPKFESEGAFSGGVTSEDENATQNSADIMNDIVSADTYIGAGKEGTPENNRHVLFEPLPTNKNSSNSNQLSSPANKAEKHMKPSGKKHARRVRRKTWIMLILTAVFISTTILYLTLLNLIANDVLETLSKSQKSIYFFFFRLYFINHVINPILYGLLDPHFRRILKQILSSVIKTCSLPCVK